MNDERPNSRRPRVFVAFSYAKSAHSQGERSPWHYCDYLCHILDEMGFEVLIGGARKSHGRLDETVLREIDIADWVIVLFCPRANLANGKHSTSPWILDEKGAAIALCKNFQILVHEDVDDQEIGGLHGSAYRIIFTRENEVEKFCEAANIISEYVRAQAIADKGRVGESAI